MSDSKGSRNDQKNILVLWKPNLPKIISILATALLLLTSCAAPIAQAPTDEHPPGSGVENVRPNMERWLEGTSVEPDMSQSPDPAKDKTVMLISCGQSTSSCARGTNGAREAADAIGWKSTVFDTKGDYSKAGEGIRQAIAQGLDGVFIYFIDCSYIKQPLQEAKAAGLPVVQAEGVDCNEEPDADPSEKALFTHSVTYVEGTLLDWISDFGAASAAALITYTNGRGDILFVGDNAAIGTMSVYDGFEEEMKKCPDCEYELIKYSFGKIYEDGLSEDLQQKLLMRPDVNAVGVTYDAILMSGVSSAVSQAVRGGEEYVLTGGEGSEAALDMARNKLVFAGPGLDNAWEGWSGIDSLNRIMQGEDPVSSGIGIELYDQNTNLPETGPYVSQIDYESVYREAWAR